MRLWGRGGSSCLNWSGKREFAVGGGTHGDGLYDGLETCKNLNRRFRSPLVVSKRGGKAGGGAVLTKTGQRVVALYHRMEAQSHAAIQKGFRRVPKRY